MKKLLLVLFALLLSTSFAGAEMYTVKPGDCLSKIAVAYRVSMRSIAKENNLKNPDVIFLGQKLKITKVSEASEKSVDFQWDKHGSNPYGDKNPIKAILKFKKLPQELKVHFLREVQVSAPEEATLKVGDRRAEMLVGGGKSVSNVVVQTKDEPCLRYTVEYGEGIFVLDMPKICDNWTWGFLRKIPQSTIIPETPAPLESVVEEKPADYPSVPVATNIAPEQSKSCDIKVFAGAGNYDAIHVSHVGDWEYAEVRCLPFAVGIGKDKLLKMGFHLFGARGAGKDEGYVYGWRKATAGPSAELYGKNWDIAADVGFGYQKSDGHEGAYKSSQTDELVKASVVYGNYYRRLNERLLFPKFMLGIDANLPTHSSHEHSWEGEKLAPKPYDNKVIELSAKATIFDYKLSDNLRLSPEWNLRVGKEYGIPDSYLKTGPSLTLDWLNRDVFNLSIYNIKKYQDENNRDSIAPIEVFIDGGELYKALSEFYHTR